MQLNLLLTSIKNKNEKQKQEIFEFLFSQRRELKWKTKM